MLVTTGLTAQADEAVAEHAAGEKVFELALHEARQAAVRRAGVLEERVQVLVHDAVQQGLLGITGRGSAGCARVCVDHERGCVGKWRAA